ncbi:assimilatory sulfite reductase (NADPH) flavoprotein subunit [Sphingosinicella sp. CPCC 101087]|uniref:assimilatory sulfite reductase (NADPH) flavoprotein subunit n=1 Tax=Sphingosinicella sp. CPCC 101087 TaxID=2497754 RepID=UPI00101D41E6|nr:assimilatory sulfite reductase (NADPH) flavoprotein subunit [Sphingosinicella sp. CPCC 101087]
MTIRETFSEGALSLEQWQHVEDLSRDLTPAQARWLSGYFAGLQVGISRAGAVALPPPSEAASSTSATRTLTILYGTETGNCAELARTLGAAAREHGLSPELFDMAEYKPRRLKDEQDILFVVSTYGEGDPPQPAVGFFEFIEGRKAPRLEQVRFSVLSLGDSTYELYCEAGKRLDRRLEALGATRIHQRVDCDIDYDEPAAQWTGEVVAHLAAEAAASAAPTSMSAIAPFPTAAAHSPVPVHDKRNPFQATIIDNIPIVGRGSSKETRHIEIDLAGSGLSHEPGDSLGIAAANDPQLVERILEAVGLAADAPLSVKGRATTLGEALERDFEITAATPRFLDHWATLSGAAELEQLRAEDRKAERMAFLGGHHVLDLLRAYPVPGLDGETFVAGLRPLQARLYSIASSFSAIPDEAHLTLSPVRYTLHDEPRVGVASAHLADRGEPGSTLPVYVQSNPHFRLPAPDLPIIMIGPGTGVAPFRAFLQEREAKAATGRSWLFFGERNFRSDFLYQTEWQAFLKDGVLTRMDVAFSRDKADKVYVQDRMREQAADLFAWLEEGAHVYVCGDAARMAPDVHEALVAIVAEQGRLERETAEEYVRGLLRDHRYQRDVY